MAVTAFFALDGFVFANWVVRIPAVKAQVGASAGSLGLALLGVSAGAMAAMLLAGVLCRSFGNPRVTVAGGVILSVTVVLPPMTHSAPRLGLALLVFGVGYGSLNVGMNSVAVDLVAALRRPVMPGFHAAYSLGALAGAGVGGLLAPHLSPTRHLLLMIPAGLLLTVSAGRVLLRYPVPRAGEEAGGPAKPRGAGPSRAGAGIVGVLGLVALCTAYGEGALNDWAALHLQQDLHSPATTAALGYAAAALAMAVGRLCGAAVLEHLGPTRTVVLGGLAAAGGMLVGALSPRVWLVLLGFWVTGLGLANIFPIAIARAGALRGPTGVAVASTLGYSGMLLGPPCIGFLADWHGLPTALTTVPLLAAVAAVLAFAIRNAVTEPGHAGTGHAGTGS